MVGCYPQKSNLHRVSLSQGRLSFDPFTSRGSINLESGLHCLGQISKLTNTDAQYSEVSEILTVYCTEY